MSQPCNDRVVGRILAGWRYDISGIPAEMREDYEDHFAHCAHCRKKKILHRSVDFALMVIAMFSAAIFAIAFGLVRHFSPRHAVILEIIALCGFAFSSLMWIIVALTTPVPVMLIGAAKIGARRVHERLPQEIRDRIPLSANSPEEN